MEKIEQRYLNTKETAKFLGLSESYLRALRTKQNKIIPFIKIGSSVRYDKQDLIKIMSLLKNTEIG